MPDGQESFVSGALRHLQANVRRAGPAAAAGYALIGAIVLLGGAGHGVDRWQGTEPWGLLAGLLAGLSSASTNWRRRSGGRDGWGRSEPPPRC